MANNDKNLILGTVKGYNFLQIKPFVETLKAVDFNGKIIFFVSKVSQKTIKKLKQGNIHIIPFKKKYPYLDIKKYPDLNNVLPKKYPYKLMDICSLRFFAYYLFLINNKKRFNKVMLTDVRDVIFQRDPFSSLGSKIYFFQEDHKISKNNPTAQWIKKIYGNQVLRELNGKNVICAGTTMGSYKKITSYLQKMVTTLVKREANRGDDQAIHNYLAYKNKITGLKILDNKTGPVLTIGKGSKSYKIKRSGVVVNDQDKTYNVIHQFDRSQVLRNKYLSSKIIIKVGLRKLFINWLKKMPWLFKFLKKLKGW